MAKQNHYNKILSTALSIFHEQGFHNSGTQDVVDLAGVSKGSFYNHFKSKDALGLAALDLYWDSFAEIRAILHDATIPPIKRIDNHFNAIGYREAGCLIANLGSELANSEMFRLRIAELFDVWISDFASCIAEGQADGSIRQDEDAEQLAEIVVSSFEGSVLKARVDRDPDVLKRFRKFINLFLKPH